MTSRSLLLLGRLAPARWATSFCRTVGSPHRDRELAGTLTLHEFTREAEELQGWLESQKQVARGGESLGEDHEHILVSRGLGKAGVPRHMLGTAGAGCGWLCWAADVVSPG